MTPSDALLNVIAELRIEVANQTALADSFRDEVGELRAAVDQYEQLLEARD